MKRSFSRSIRPRQGRGQSLPTNRRPSGSAKARQQGSILVVTLLTCTILGFVLGSYLLLIRTQNLSVARAQAWNAGVAVAEAGVEEALAHLNNNSIFFTAPNLATDGWTAVGNYVVVPRRFVGSNYYDVSILVATNPVIYATGYTKVPISGNVLARAIRVKTAPTSLFNSSMVSLTNISLSGSGIETDSYDSSDDRYSTDGEYDPARARDHGDLITNSNSTDKNRPAIALGNGRIRGRVRTGPTGLVTMNGASVGDAAWVNAATPGIKPGWYVNDVNISIPSVQAPYTTGLLLPPPGNLNSVPDYILPTGDYYLNGTFKQSSTSKTNILVTGNVRLYVTGDFIANGKIAIQPGGSLKLFVGTKDTSKPSSTALGSVFVDHAKNFQYYGLPSNNSLVYNGGNDFRSILYAPSATAKLGGGGNSDYDFRGTYFIYSMDLNGHFKFHFDEYLPQNVAFRGYLAASWEEL